MIKGEGAMEITPKTSSPDWLDESSPWVDQKPQVTNASPDSSDNSSGEESEFERYCSANSVMGTPSLCSSVGTCNDFLDLDFGSVKNLGVGEDRALENVVSRGRLARNLGDRSVSTSGGFDYFLQRSEYCDEDVDVTNGDSLEEARMPARNENWSKPVLSSGNRHGSSVPSKVENGLESPQSSNTKTLSQTRTYDDNNIEDLKLSRVQRGSDILPTFAENNYAEVVGATSNEEQPISMGTKLDCLLGSSDSPLSTTAGEDKFREQVNDSFDPFDVKENGSLEEDGTSSRYEHSDDDDSMFNYGTDDECRMNSNNTRNLHYLQDYKRSNENPLLIGSSVAFGSEDWDDFMHETENSLVSLTLDKFNDKQQENVEAEGLLMNFIPEVLVSARNAGREQAKIVTTAPVTTCIASGKADLEICSIRDSLAQETDILAEKTSLMIDLNIKGGAADKELQCINKEEVIGHDVGNASETFFCKKSNVTAVQSDSSATTELPGKEALRFEDLEVHELQTAIENDFSECVNTATNYSPASLVQSEEHVTPSKVGNLELKESHDEVVLEMEEILLDSMETPGARVPYSNRSPKPFRDGSSTASTSGTDDAYPLVQHSFKIDDIEVVGAKQKKGDVSLGERLVGVKEYTVYLLRVWSGKDDWEVERRYRDFFTLYRQLRTLYSNHGWSLPTPWSRVEQESRKFFGNASPNVVNERSTLIQECLRSILHSDTPDCVPGTLTWFLSPQKAISSSSLLNTLVPQSASAFMGGTYTEDLPTFGKTISLLVEIQPRKSVKQLLEAQHYICAGCHKRLDAEKTLMREFVQTLGWGKPRLCEYTGQLFCVSCHANETAVLPARVLHFWDFTEYPVSQMAKSYLDSIYNQPMLCVSAVNPFLFSKVPVLLHVMVIRKKIEVMMPYVRCPFRRSIQGGVASRKYLLENNEFFALRDLVDLSKGAFSTLPLMVKTLSKKILDHITQQCLVCCDVGISCGARQACEDPSSLIFPFQEDEVKRCKSCESVFHKPCFRKLLNCPCMVSDVGKSTGLACNIKQESTNQSDVALDALARKPSSGSPVRFLSSLFSKNRQEKELRRKSSNPVILMGSLPSTFSDPL